MPVCDGKDCAGSRALVHVKLASGELHYCGHHAVIYWPGLLNLITEVHWEPEADYFRYKIVDGK